MEIKGHIVQILPLQSGISQASGREWKKQEYVLETGDQYPRKVCFQLFGDRVDQFPMTVGEEVIVSFDIESREYNGRWYTNVSAWKVDKVAVSAVPMEGSIPPPPFEPEPSDDDLPF
ncbi:DUF3127 domain-containing protein [Coprobacter sp.]